MCVTRSDRCEQFHKASTNLLHSVLKTKQLRYSQAEEKFSIVHVPKRTHFVELSSAKNEGIKGKGQSHSLVAVRGSDCRDSL